MSVNNITEKDFLSIMRYGENFSTTGKLSEYSIQVDWVDGYQRYINNQPYNEYSNLWKIVDRSIEDIGSKFYEKIINYIDNVSNIDVCSIASVDSYCRLYGLENVDVAIYNTFPPEIQNIADIFSINKAFLTGSNTLSALNSVLINSVATDLVALSADDVRYVKYIQDMFYNTLLNMCNLKYRSDELSEVSQYEKSIWEYDPPKYISENLDQLPASIDSTYIESERTRLDVEVSFDVLLHVEYVLSGLTKISNYTPNQQKLIELVIEYGNRGVLLKTLNINKFYYLREIKVFNYLKFVSAYSGVKYSGTDYSLTNGVLELSDDESKTSPIVLTASGTYELDISVIETASRRLTDYCLKISYLRDTIKQQAQKYYMIGTEKLLKNSIKEIIYSSIYNSNDEYNYWRYISEESEILNKDIKPLSNFNVDVVEYLDPVEYFNIQSASGDVMSSSRYWTDDETYPNNTLSQDEIIKFYQKIGMESQFSSSYSAVSSDYTSLKTFLDCIFNSGAVSSTSSDFSYSELSSDSPSSYSVNLFKKYIGIPELGNTPFTNVKNNVHPSYQAHPYLYAFSEYVKTYSNISSLFNQYVLSDVEIFDIVKQKIDTFGNTIAFYIQGVVDFSGYNTQYEMSDNDESKFLNIDSPFNMSALQEYMGDKDTFTASLLSGTNEYYNNPLLSLNLNESARTKIATQLQTLYFNIYELRNYHIYKYGKDNNGNSYYLYKRTMDRHEPGQLWLKFKNHPIAFPAFVFNTSASQYTTFSDISQITDTNSIVLKDIFDNIQNYTTSDVEYLTQIHATPGKMYFADLRPDYIQTIAPTTIGLSGTYTADSICPGGTLDISNLSVYGEYEFLADSPSGYINLTDVSISGIYNENSINSPTGTLSVTGMSLSGFISSSDYVPTMGYMNLSGIQLSGNFDNFDFTGVSANLYLGATTTATISGYLNSSTAKTTHTVTQALLQGIASTPFQDFYYAPISSNWGTVYIESLVYKNNSNLTLEYFSDIGYVGIETPTSESWFKTTTLSYVDPRFNAARLSGTFDTIALSSCSILNFNSIYGTGTSHTIQSAKLKFFTGGTSIYKNTSETKTIDFNPDVDYTNPIENLSITLGKYSTSVVENYTTWGIPSGSVIYVPELDLNSYKSYGTPALSSTYTFKPLVNCKLFDVSFDVSVTSASNISAIPTSNIIGIDCQYIGNLSTTYTNSTYATDYSTFTTFGPKATLTSALSGHTVAGDIVIANSNDYLSISDTTTFTIDNQNVTFIGNYLHTREPDIFNRHVAYLNANGGASHISALYNKYTLTKTLSAGYYSLNYVNGSTAYSTALNGTYSNYDLTGNLEFIISNTNSTITFDADALRYRNSTPAYVKLNTSSFSINNIQSEKFITSSYYQKFSFLLNNAEGSPTSILNLNKLGPFTTPPGYFSNITNLPYRYISDTVFETIGFSDELTKTQIYKFIQAGELKFILNDKSSPTILTVDSSSFTAMGSPISLKTSHYSIEYGRRLTYSNSTTNSSLSGACVYNTHITYDYNNFEVPYYYIKDFLIGGENEILTYSGETSATTATDYKQTTFTKVISIPETAGFGMTRAFAISERGIFHSSDGTTWDSVSTFDNKVVTDIVYDSDYVYACVNKSGVYKFNSLTGETLSASTLQPTKFAINGTTSAIITTEGLYTKLSSDDDYVNRLSGTFFDVIYGDGEWIVAGADGKIYYSVTGGDTETWTVVNNTIMPQTTFSSIKQNGNAYFLTSYNDGVFHLNSSKVISRTNITEGHFNAVITNSLSGSMAVAVGNQTGTYYNSDTLLSPSAWTIASFTTSSNSPYENFTAGIFTDDTFIAIGSDVVKYSTTSGSTWTYSDIKTSELKSIAILGSRLIACGKNVIMYSDNKTLWNYITTQKETVPRSIRDITSSQNYPNRLLATSDHGLLQTADNDSTQWSVISGTDGYDINKIFDATVDGITYKTFALTSLSGIITLDSVSGWVCFDKPSLTGSYSDYIEVDINSTKTFIVAGPGLFKSTNLTSFSSILSNIDGAPASDVYFNKLLSNPIEDLNGDFSHTQIYAVGSSGLFKCLSAEVSLSFTQINTPTISTTGTSSYVTSAYLTNSYQSVSSITTDGTTTYFVVGESPMSHIVKGNYTIVASDDYGRILYSTDNGATFNQTFIRTSRSNNYITKLKFLEGKFFICTNNGLQYSYNGYEWFPSKITGLVTDIIFSSQFIAISKNSGIWLSDDGQYWTNVHRRGSFNCCYSETGLDQSITNTFKIKTIGISEILKSSRSGVLKCYHNTQNIYSYDDVYVGESGEILEDYALTSDYGGQYSLERTSLKLFGCESSLRISTSSRLTDRVRTIENLETTYTKPLGTSETPQTVNMWYWNTYIHTMSSLSNIAYTYTPAATDNRIKPFYTIGFTNKIFPNSTREPMSNGEFYLSFDWVEAEQNQLYVATSIKPMTFNATTPVLYGKLTFVDLSHTAQPGVKTIIDNTYSSAVRHTPTSCVFNTFSFTPDSETLTTKPYSYYTTNYKHFVTTENLDIENTETLERLTGYIDVLFDFSNSTAILNVNRLLKYNNSSCKTSCELSNLVEICKGSSLIIDSELSVATLRNISFKTFAFSFDMSAAELLSTTFNYEYLSNNLLFKVKGLTPFINDKLSAAFETIDNLNQVFTGDLVCKLDFSTDASTLTLLSDKTVYDNFLKYNSSPILLQNGATSSDFSTLYFTETFKDFSAKYNYTTTENIDYVPSQSIVGNLDIFNDFGFTPDNSIIFIDYPSKLTASRQYDTTNTLYGSVGDMTLDSATGINVKFSKDTAHNFESLPLTKLIIENYKHVDTITNSYDTYEIFTRMTADASENNYLDVIIYKYNSQTGLSSRRYSIMVKYSEYVDSTSYDWVCSCSDNKLAIAFMTNLPDDLTIGNYISGHRNSTEGGRTSISDIKSNTFDNSITLVEFDISDNSELPDSPISIKYIIKNTDVGYYPQYAGEAGKNNIFSNPVIQNDKWFKLQLFGTGIDSTNIDQIYEQSMAATGLCADMSILGLTGDVSDMLYSETISSGNGETYPPGRWFRKYDLSGNVSDIGNLLDGVDVGGMTLSGTDLSAYIFKTAGTSSESYYPIQQTVSDQNINYSYFEIDEGYPIRAYHTINSTTLMTENIIFDTLDDSGVYTTDKYTLDIANATQPIDYRIGNDVKSYLVTLMDLEKKQFLIERL